MDNMVTKDLASNIKFNNVSVARQNEATELIEIW